MSYLTNIIATVILKYKWTLAVRITVTSCDHAKVPVPWTTVILALAGFQILTKVSIGRQPEFNLIGQ